MKLVLCPDAKQSAATRCRPDRIVLKLPLIPNVSESPALRDGGLIGRQHAAHEIRKIRQRRHPPFSLGFEILAVAVHDILTNCLLGNTRLAAKRSDVPHGSREFGVGVF